MEKLLYEWRNLRRAAVWSTVHDWRHEVQKPRPAIGRMEAEMSFRHVESYFCDGCGRSLERVCEVWTIGGRDYCRRCLDVDRSRKSSRAYIAVAFSIVLLTLVFATTPKHRAQDNDRRLYVVHHLSDWSGEPKI
jgi:hypothetical protein